MSIKREDIKDDATRMKIIMTALGVIEGLHSNIDALRESDGVNSERHPIDHNIEQAQIALENASMRLMQVRTWVLDRMEGESDD